MHEFVQSLHYLVCTVPRGYQCLTYVGISSVLIKVNPIKKQHNEQVMVQMMNTW